MTPFQKLKTPRRPVAIEWFSLVTAAFGMQACASVGTSANPASDIAQTPSGVSQKILRPTSSEGVLSGQSEGSPHVSFTGEHKKELQNLLQLFSKRQWTDLEARAQKLVRRLEATGNASSTHSSLQAARNLWGMSLLFLDRSAEAEPIIKLAFDEEKDPSVKPYYGYNLASALADSKRWPEAKKLIDTLNNADFDRMTRVKFLALRARAMAGTQAHAESARAWLELQGIAGEMLESQLIREKLVISLDQIQDPILVDSLVQDFYLSRLGDELLWRLAQIKLSTAEREAAQQLLGTLIEKFPKSAHAGEASKLLRENDGSTVVAPKKIGALLPLTGKLSRFGRKSLQSIQLALGIYTPSDDTDSGTRTTENKTKDLQDDWTLVIEDSGEDEATAKAALERLANEQGASVIVGPLSSKGVEPLSKRADELGIPLITLSQQPAREGYWTFNAGMTAESQTREIVRYALKTLNLKRFAILHPRDRFGDEYAKLFWDAVDAEGGEIRGIESYSPGETDFRMVVDKLSGLAWPEARTREIRALEVERVQLKITKRNMKTEKYYALPPIVDFDAVFIADEPRVAAQIIPTFAYRDINGVRFLGTAAWNTPELYARAQAQAEGAIFPDVFFAGGGSSTGSMASSRFRNDYRATFHQEPTAVDAMAYDTTVLLKNVLNAMPDSVRRSDIRQQLKDIGEVLGAAGKLKSDESGTWNRSLQILEIRGGKTTLAQ